MLDLRRDDEGETAERDSEVPRGLLEGLEVPLESNSRLPSFGFAFGSFSTERKREFLDELLSCLFMLE